MNPNKTFNKIFKPNTLSYKILFGVFSVSLTLFFGWLITIILAGTLNPTDPPTSPPLPPEGTMKTLEDIYCKMIGCTPASYDLDSSTNPSPTMYTLLQIYNRAPNFKEEPGNASPSAVCDSKQFYTDTNTIQTGTRTNYQDGKSYCCAGKELGQVCNHNDQCISGHCIDGYCCNNACTETCMGCNISGSLGTCTYVPNDQQGRNCITTCYACNGLGSCVAKNTNWNAGTLGCTSGNSRCVSGICRTCGGYLASDNCGGCAGQGGLGCWYNGPGSCNNVCSSLGGCIQANWNDDTACNVCKAMFPGYSCQSGSGYIMKESQPMRNILGYNVCRYRPAGYNQICSSGQYSGFYRLCICAY